MLIHIAGDIDRQLIFEEIIQVKRGCLLVRCSRPPTSTSENEMWTYYEALRSEEFYRKRIQFSEGTITNMGFFNYKEQEVLVRFSNVINGWLLAVDVI